MNFIISSSLECPGGFVSCHPLPCPVWPHHTQFAVWAVVSEVWERVAEERAVLEAAGPEEHTGTFSSPLKQQGFSSKKKTKVQRSKVWCFPRVIGF